MNNILFQPCINEKKFQPGMHLESASSLIIRTLTCRPATKSADVSRGSAFGIIAALIRVVCDEVVGTI